MLWLQTELEVGCKRYRYPGWQWRLARAHKRLQTMPLIAQVTNAINMRLPSDKPMNHAICTIYKDGRDGIGFHSDNPTDFAENAGFIVLKLGAARPFQFGIKNSDGSVQTFFEKDLPAGTAVLVGADVNKETLHAVKDHLSCSEPSGSIVWRCIKTVIPWSQVDLKITRSEKSRQRKRESKDRGAELDGNVAQKKMK